MAKKTKEESVDLFSFEEKPKTNKNNKTNKSKKKTSKTENKTGSKSTKDKKFNFDEEIIIGLKRVEEVDKGKDKKVSEQEKKGKTENKKIQRQGKKKVEQNKAKNGQAKKEKINKTTKVLSPKEQLAQKKRQAVFRIFKWLTLLLIIIGGTIFTLLSPLFNITVISVVNNEKISTDEIISLSGIQLEENIFKYRKDIVIDKIKENAYIDTVKVRRKLPDTIEITVEERKASFMIQFANAYALIDNQGYILEISSNNAGLPEILGSETDSENIQVGNRLCTKDLKKLGDVLRIMESANSNGLASLITKIDISDQDDYILMLEKNKKTVYLGDTSNLSTKMLWILMFNEKEKNKAGEIILNMNLNDEKNSPYFREKV